VAVINDAIVHLLLLFPAKVLSGNGYCFARRHARSVCVSVCLSSYSGRVSP